MRIYRKVVMDLKGGVIEEDSYEYAGAVSECKGGRIGAEKRAEAAATKSYQLQLSEAAYQKEQLAKIRDEETAKTTANRQRQLELQRTGVGATILTVKRKPEFADFEAQYRSINSIGDLPEEEYMKQMRAQYNKMQPFQRLIAGPPKIRKASLYA